MFSGGLNFVTSFVNWGAGSETGGHTVSVAEIDDSMRGDSSGQCLWCPRTTQVAAVTLPSALLPLLGVTFN